MNQVVANPAPRQSRWRGLLELSVRSTNYGGWAAFWRIWTALGLFFDALAKFFIHDLEADRILNVRAEFPVHLMPLFGGIEALVGLLLLLGLFVRPVAVLVFVSAALLFLPHFIPDLIGEGLTRTVLRKNPYNTLCGMPWLVFLGAGKWSLDALIESRLKGARQELMTPTDEIDNDPVQKTSAEDQNRNE
ncbi:MAG: TQO small subunit DoxD [Armatimonadota bacterium]|jgi:uncharacterized membrane protein YphA (DoxX/SURF4 family)|nr:hypothetical protein [Fimbriimonadaceae bacterium]MCZ8139900.1 hypothetical protein [Fimbriimonadaceae bacterium]